MDPEHVIEANLKFYFALESLDIDLMDEVCLAKIPDETVSMRCGGDGFAVFFGLATPVRTPVIGSQVRRW